MDTPSGISRERLEQALAHSTFAQLLGAEWLDFAPGRVSLLVLKAGQRQAVCRADVFAVRDGAEKLLATGLATIARV